MPSELKSETARRNGAKSRGPKTEEGKARSAQNARKMHHGVPATRLLPGVHCNEDPADFDAFHAIRVAALRPSDDYESFLVLEITRAEWRSQRFHTIETAIFDLQIFHQASRIENFYDTFDDAARSGAAFYKLSEEGVIADITRYAAQVGRDCVRTMNALRHYRELRDLSPSGNNGGNNGASNTESTITQPPAAPSAGPDVCATTTDTGERFVASADASPEATLREVLTDSPEKRATPNEPASELKPVSVANAKVVPIQRDPDATLEPTEPADPELANPETNQSPTEIRWRVATAAAA